MNLLIMDCFIYFLFLFFALCEIHFAFVFILLDFVLTFLKGLKIISRRIIFFFFGNREGVYITNNMSAAFINLVLFEIIVMFLTHF